MAREYEDLSRRALIKLNHDFDRDNDEELLKYFEAMDPTEHYEGIRMVEKVQATGDKIWSDVTGNTGAIKNAAMGAVEGILNKAVNLVGKIAGSAL